MSPNADTIVQELHAEFESMLSYVQANHTATADEMNAGCCGGSWSLGARLMLSFFALRTAQVPRTAYRLVKRGDGAGHWRTSAARSPLWGSWPFGASYFYRGGRRRYPAGSGIPRWVNIVPDVVRELTGYFGVGSTYAKVAACFAQILGFKLSTQAIS